MKGICLASCAVMAFAATTAAASEELCGSVAEPLEFRHVTTVVRTVKIVFSAEPVSEEGCEFVITAHSNFPEAVQLKAGPLTPLLVVPACPDTGFPEFEGKPVPELCMTELGRVPFNPAVQKLDTRQFEVYATRIGVKPVTFGRGEEVFYTLPTRPVVVSQ